MNNALTIESKNNSLSNQIQNLIIFIHLRKHNKNSLNKIKLNNNNPNNQKNNEKPNDTQAFFAIVQQLMDNIAQGHTILEIENILPEMLQTWQLAGWVYLLDNHTVIQADLIDRPLVIQTIIGQNKSDKKSHHCAVWLHRQWFAERQLVSQLLEIAQRSVPNLTPNTDDTNETKDILSPQFNTAPNLEQRQAISNACHFALSIITGGPGTGKTYTVAQLVKALNFSHLQQKKHNRHLPPLSIALTAPTGKAAQRMQASLLKSLGEEKIALDNAKTLHRLLGIGTDGVPRYHKNNPLPDDLVVVDEASMLGLELASLLVDAIKPTGRLILLGDAYQLAAVDAGAVLADLCEMPELQPYRTQLLDSQRFSDDSAIGQLAHAIKLPMQTKAEKQKKLTAIHRLFANPMNPTPSDNSENIPVLQFFPLNDFTEETLHKILAEPYQAFFNWTRQWYKQFSQNQPITENPNIAIQAHIQSNLRDFVGSDEARALFAVFDDYRILSAGHHGEFGVTAINSMLTRLHKSQLQLPRSDSPFYHGQPIMMQKNDYQLGLFNGDIGICLQVLSATGTPQLLACFPEKVIDVSRLSLDSVVTAYAMTIHKSQGSEFSTVAVCLDPVHERLLSQELIYTAVTRSKKRLMVFSQTQTLDTAVLRKGNRQTGLTLQNYSFNA